MNQPSVLVVRLGAMGDILHTLPAVAALHASGARITWAVEPKWLPLLEGNPHLTQTLAIDRTQLFRTLARLRTTTYDCAVDFQGLLKSVAVAYASGAGQIYGFDRGTVRESAAAVFYNHRVTPRAEHVVDKNLELAVAAGAVRAVPSFWIPAGHPEGSLPATPFVLANPLAGWGSKQWPLEHFLELSRLLRAEGLELVLNAPKSIVSGDIPVHISGLPGLIDATRRAIAVVGLDSGPLHLAAALGKPGVAIFGPTDPARNGPYGGSLTVLRTPAAATTYKRRSEVDDSMRAITPEQVWAALKPQLL